MPAATRDNNNKKQRSQEQKRVGKIINKSTKKSIHLLVWHICAVHYLRLCHFAVASRFQHLSYYVNFASVRRPMVVPHILLVKNKKYNIMGIVFAHKIRLDVT